MANASGGGGTGGPSAGTGKLNPGDDAPAGTPGTGEDVCPKCQGSGKQQGNACPNCGGTGVVIKGVAGG
jgi:DnaJ-class molecular chaperone